MATLPRMKPKCFYDVVIEVAHHSAGPDPGRHGASLSGPAGRQTNRSPISIHRFEPVLDRTLGVPSVPGANAQNRNGHGGFFRQRSGRTAAGAQFSSLGGTHEQSEPEASQPPWNAKDVAPDKIEKIIHSICSFALYGFPESHAISFAILAYGSAYLKVHRAPEFYASLLNNQPMGFYTPATIVKDAQRHGLKIKPVCVSRSDWRCTVVDDNTIRLGFCVVSGLNQQHGEEIRAATARSPI